MKLADWARKQGIAYLTAYRWFKDDKLPVKAYQSDSGTIIVEDDDDKLEQSMQKDLINKNGDVFGLVLKKVVEYSKNNLTIEDFAAYMLSNFSIRLNSDDSPRYSKNKPKTEDIQKHFQQFIPKGERPKPNMFVADNLDELVNEDEVKTANEFNSLFVYTNNATTVKNISDESIVTENYVENPFDRSLCRVSSDTFDTTGQTGVFTPTKKELELVTKAIKQKTSKRGRKLSKNAGKTNESNK